MRRKRATLKEKIIAGALILLLLWLLFLVWGIFRKEEIARQKAEDSKRQLAALAEREATLKQNIADLRTDRGQDASIRETYGVARPGEEVIIVVPSETGDTVQKDPWWKVVLSWLGFK